MPPSAIATLGDIVVRSRRLHARRAAVVDGARTITYGEFGARAFRLANALIDLGVRRQERVAILAENAPEYLEFYAACEVAGFVAVPVNYRLSVPEMKRVLADAQPSVLLFQGGYADHARQLRAALPGIVHHIAIDGPADGALAYEALLAEASAELPAQLSRPGDIASIIYTSGTTGLPKGAMMSHEGQVGFIQWQSLDLAVRADDKVLLVMPFYHIGAKCNQLGWSLAGATIVLHRRYDIRAIAQAIETERVTAAHLAPVMVQDLLGLPDLDRYDHSSLRCIQYASGPLATAPLKVALQRYGQILVQIYGMTEAGSCSILQPRDHILDGTPDEVRRLGSAGQPTLGHDIRVVRPDGSECAPEERGEILVKAPGMMVGYWNNHAATLEALKDGWLHSGDIGFYDHERYLFVVDRKKDMIISGGENIYPREVEEAIYLHPAVAEVAVIGVPDERWGEAVKAFVVLRPDAECSGEEIVEHCRSLIASYKKPKSVEFLAELPRLANKKIDKKALRLPFWQAQSRNV